MLTERLLQFIWQFQYFNKQALLTTNEEGLSIIHPGTYNTNQGPDFLDAKIKRGNTIWAGNIEIHINASHWLLHQHQNDDNYNNVILHVVWSEDKKLNDRNGTPIPTFVIEPHVSKLMLEHYQRLMNEQGFVPCEHYLPVLSPLGWQSWQERLLIERLQKRAGLVFQRLKETGNHWEEVFWYQLARNFGAPVNSDAFESMAQSIPVSVLAKHKNQIHQLEALLLGQSNLLGEESNDDYVLLLQREYSFLKSKYKLKESPNMPVFLRMRPLNFPTVRLAQLAMLIHQSEHLFSKIVEAKESKDVVRLLNVTANDFWHYHYQMNAASPYKPKALGETMAGIIMMNTVVPVVFAYGLYHNIQAYKDKAMEWLMQLKGEQNGVIKSWKLFDVNAGNALQTQALLELKKHYCDKRKCLDCAVGNKILKQA
ncbi:MAG: DUF2851 family protein [Bacteroidota bacterium]|nr:DUF2851 family protein [Bacteroidota bacterium]